MKKGTARSTPEEREIKARVAQLTALHKTLLEITAQRDLTKLLQTIVRRATRLLKGKNGGLYLCNSDKQACTCAVSYRTTRDYTGTVLRYGEGAAGNVAASGQPLLIDDYRTWDTRAQTFELEQPFRAMLAAPMLWHGQVTGVIIVQREQPFNQADLDLLTMFASQATIAVENVRALEAERSARIQAQKDISERMCAEETLRASEERYQTLFLRSPIGIGLADSECRFLDVNEAFCQMLGYSRNELLELTVLDLTYPDDRQQYRSLSEDVVLGASRGYQTEKRYMRKDGTALWVDVTTARITAPDGDFLYGLGMVEDITERKRVEEALRHSQEETAHANRLLLALSQVSQAVQRTRTTEEVYSAIQDQVTEMGYLTAGFELLENGRDLQVAYFNYRADLQRKAEKMTGVPLRDFRFRPREDSIYHRIIVKGETVFVQDTAKAVADALPRNLRALARPMRDLFKLDQSIFAPLTVSNETIGLLAITGSDLTEADIPAVTAFARQAAIAMQNARLYEQAQRDIVVHRRAEEKLKASEAELLALFAGMIDVVIVYDNDGRYIKIAPTNPANLYHPPDDMLGKTLHDILPKEKADYILSMIRASIQNDTVVVGEYALEVSGKETWFSTSSSRLSETTAILVAHDITERKQAEEALRESEEKHRTLFERMEQGVVYQDADGKIISANPAAERILGLTLDQMQGRISTDPRWKAIHEDGSDFPGDTHPSMVALATGKEVYNVVMGVFNPEKEAYKWINIIAIPQFRLGETIPYRVFTTLEDFTERKRAEEAQRESEERYQELFENINSGVAVYEVIGDGQDFIFKDFNHAGEMIDHDQRKRLIGKSIFEVRPGVEQFGLIDVLRQVWQTGVPGFHPVTMYQDNRLTGWYENYIYKLPSGEIVAVFENITERKQNEEALRESEMRLRFHVENSPMAVVEWDTNFMVTRWSGEAEKIFGWSREETIGKPIMEMGLIYEEDIPIVQNVMKRLNGGISRQVVSTNRNYTKDGKVIYCEWYNSVLQNPQGQMISVMSQALDITERKQAEKEIESLSRFPTENPNPILRVEQDGQIIYANLASEALLHLWNCTVGGYLPPHWRERLVNASRASVRTTVEVECEERFYSILIVPIPDQGYVNLYGRDITELKLVEAQLIEHHATLNALLESATSPVFSLDRDYCYTSFNNAHAAVMKGLYGAEIEIGQSMLEYQAVPEDRENARKNLDRALKGEQVVESAYSGEPGRLRRYFEIAHNPIFDTAGEVIGVSVFASDITERKRSEDVLRESQQLLKKTFVSMLDAVFIIDADSGEVMDCNPASSAIFGYNRQEILNRTTAFLHVDQASLEEFRQHLNRAVKEKGFLFLPEFKMKRKDGTVFPTEHSVVPLENEQGKIIGWVSVVRDITERKGAEDALRNREGLLHKIFDILPVGLWIADKDGQLLRGNPAGVKIWGAEPKVGPLEYGVFKGRRLPSREEVAPDDWALVHTIKDKVTIVDELLEIDAFDGQKKMILNYTAPVLDAQGNVQGAIVVNQDITERKHAEAELVQSHEQLRALASYWQNSIEDERAYIAREIHDEFGQSMTALKMDLVWLANHLPEGDEKVDRIRGMTSLVDESVALMRRIATDLRPGLLDDLGLNAALEWQSQEFSKRSGIPCKLKLPKGDLDLDPAMSTSLFRIFQETLTNINRHAQATRVNASLNRNKQTLVLTVRDNGRGITEGELTNPRSLGLLGLRERAAQWGGETTLRGTTGKGTTVTVRIPLPASSANGGDR
jgi:PAS domain S-box-containing protein